MSNAVTPRLVVCDLDQNLLGHRAGETELLDTWMAWERGRRPLLLFHSVRTVEELQHLLPSSVLPPADFLIGGSAGMLVRHSYWNHDHGSDAHAKFAGFEPEHLLASVASEALAQLNAPAGKAATEFPKVENAVLTMAGLSITFCANGKRSRRPGPNAALAWLLAQLQLDPSEVRTYDSTVNPRPRRVKAVV